MKKYYYYLTFISFLLLWWYGLQLGEFISNIIVINLSITVVWFFMSVLRMKQKESYPHNVDNFI